MRFQRVTGIYSKHHLHHEHPPYLHSAWSAEKRRQTIHLVGTVAKRRILIGNEKIFHDWAERIVPCLVKRHVWYNSVAMVSSWHVNKRSLNYWPFVRGIRSPVDSSRTRPVMRYFGVFFVNPNNLLNRRQFEAPSRQCDVTIKCFSISTIWNTWRYIILSMAKWKLQMWSYNGL